MQVTWSSDPNMLLSGSQDGTMKYFDIRVKVAVNTFVRLFLMIIPFLKDDV